MSVKETAWHNLTLGQVFKEINSSAKGLTDKEAKKRLEKYGPNILATAKKFSAFSLFFSQFKSSLVYVLIIAGFISLFFGEFVDAYVIFGAVFINVIVGFIQEKKANQSLEKLSKVVKQEALVLRESQEQKVESSSLVPGDIIILSAGNRVPADARLLEINEFEVNEATLTGESWPVKKTLNNLSVGTVLAERNNMVFMGTLVVEGRAKAVVAHTGFNTEMGKITVMLKDTEDEKTPLQEKLDSFAKTITKVIVIIALGLFIFGILEGNQWVDMFTLAVAVAVSAIPESLAITMTMILTVGMQRILRHNGLVRRLISAETLGSTTVICTDKTGTLTEGEMRVNVLTTNNHFYDLQASSWRDLEADEEIKKMVDISLLCNDSLVQNAKDPVDDWLILGSPTEKALFIFGIHMQDSRNLIDSNKRLEEVPFDSQRKFMLTRHSYDSQHDIIYLKGAPEKLLNFCSDYLDTTKKLKLSKNKIDYFNKAWQDLSKKGLRVLAGAYKIVAKDFQEFSTYKEKPENFCFVGIWGLADPLRREAKDTLEKTLAAGIKTVIITGDNKFTAQTIARDLGIELKANSVVTGDELLQMTDEELNKKITDIKVYARVTPADKLRIIKAWQNRGEVVSMTGDGVNDAPALKAADIGVAVSSGSDVAKETADLVLLDNNFSTIVMAIKQGRVIFANIKRVILYLLSDSFSEVILVVGSMILHMPMPITAAQILWINLISDSLPALSLTIEPEDKEIMNSKPDRKKTLVDFETKFLIATISIITAVTGLWLFWHFDRTTGDLAISRTAVFTALGIDTLLYSFSIKNLKHSIFRMHPFRNKYLNSSVLIGLLVQLAAIYTPVLNKLLKTEPLAWSEWDAIFLVIFIEIAFIEVVKEIFLHHIQPRRKK